MGKDQLLELILVTAGSKCSGSGLVAYCFTQKAHGPMKVIRQYDSWIKRRLRCYLWKQWGRAGYRRLCALGVSRDLAWNTCKSAHGPWRLSRSPAPAFALPARYFADLGLPSLLGYQLNQLNRGGT
jgi:hypothetical protein